MALAQQTQNRWRRWLRWLRGSIAWNLRHRLPRVGVWLPRLLRSTGGVFRVWLRGIFRFSRNSGAFVLDCWQLVLSVVEWIGYVSIGLATNRLVREWLKPVVPVVYGAVPSVSLGVLLYALVLLAKPQSLVVWLVLVLSQLIGVSWVCRWLRPIQSRPPEALRGIYYLFFYVVSSFSTLVTMSACTYMAAAKVGGAVFDSTTAVPLLGFWEYMRFSILTATTLGQNNITTAGISSLVECAEVIQFWFLVVILGWRLQASPGKSACVGLPPADVQASPRQRTEQSA